MIDPRRQPIDPNEVYKVAEAAAVCRLGTRTMLKLAKRGDIDHIRVGRTIRFMGSSLLDFLHGGGTTRPVNLLPDQIRRRPKTVA